jgi:hypothetical protein
MDSFEDGKGSPHSSFLQMFFQVDDQIASTHDRDVQNREKRETPQRDFGAM